MLGVMLENLHMDIWHVTDETERARRDELFEQEFKGDLSQLNNVGRLAFLWGLFELVDINVRKSDLKTLTDEERKVLGDIGREGLHSRNQHYLSHTIPIERHMKQRSEKWRQILPSLLQDYIKHLQLIVEGFEIQRYLH